MLLIMTLHDREKQLFSIYIGTDWQWDPSHGLCVQVVCVCACVCVHVHPQSYLTLFNPMDCSLLGSSAHGIFQARILEQVAISHSRESF